MPAGFFIKGAIYFNTKNISPQYLLRFKEKIRISDYRIALRNRFDNGPKSHH